MRKTIGLALFVALTLVLDSRAAVIYSTAGSTYSQDFDSLPNTPENASLGSSPTGWTDDNASPGVGNFSIVGWYLYHPTVQSEGGFSGHQRMRIGRGNSTTGAFMSWGSTGSTDRALGMLNSNTFGPEATGTTPASVSFYGARFTNNTGSVLDSFTLSYTGEQWHEENTTAQSITFDYSLNATSIEDGAATFTTVPALDFTSPTFVTATSTALDGNAAANRSVIGPVTVTGLNWQPGADLWIRWSDINDTGRDQGMGLDDLSFSADVAAVPEPASFALALIACLIGLARRR